MAERKKVACPDCGKHMFSLAKHRGNRPCRAAQVVKRMDARGFVPLTSLAWARFLRHAGVPYLRIPANGINRYSNSRAWRYKPSPKLLSSVDYDASDPIYSDLGDVLFVRSWVPVIIRGWGMTSPFRHTVKVLKKVQDNEALQKMIPTVQALGGRRAVFSLLEAANVC